MKIYSFFNKLGVAGLGCRTHFGVGHSFPTTPQKIPATFWVLTFWSLVRSYIALTKPTIVLSYCLTGATAMILAGGLSIGPIQFMLILTAITFTAASANGLNQYFERELDAQMERTRKRRPLPLKKMEPKRALWFSILLGVAAVLYLAIAINPLSSSIALGTILFYSFFYTLWLKPRTPYNIVIGGAAGATAPLIGCAAVSGNLSLAPWLMFLIIFMWTPPHFWALALCVKDQYAKAGIPMLPVVKGDERTRQEIWWYSLLLVPLTLSLTVFKICGWVYFLGALGLGLGFIYCAWQVKSQKTQKGAYRLFGYSIIYLMLLFIMMIIDYPVSH